MSQRLLRRDADIAALISSRTHAARIIEHGVKELLTVDRDFMRFHGTRVRSAFAGR